MSWQDTEISIHRSSADPEVWSANIPYSEVEQILRSAGRLRRCQQWVLDNASIWNYELGGRQRWVKDGPDVMLLHTWID